jgi:hypothetical protein
MKYERFLKIILSLQKEQKTIKTLYDNGVDLINFVDTYHVIITELIKEIYGEEGYDWFSWYCYENEFGQKDWSNEKGEEKYGACDAEGNPICYSHESLWEYLEKECESKQ